jgi:chromosome segregation ATPase
VVHLLYFDSSFRSILSSLRAIIMADKPAAFQQLLNKAAVESRAMRTGGIGVKRRDLERQGVELETLADWVDAKEKEVEKLQKEIEHSTARLLTAEQESDRVMNSLSEEDRKRYESGQSVDLEALDAIKEALQEEPGLLDGLVEAMPNLPLPSSLTVMLSVAKDAKEAVSKLKPGIGSLATQVADARNALEALKKQIQEEAAMRATAVELAGVQQKSADLKSILDVQIQELERKLEKAEADAAAQKWEAGQNNALNFILRMEKATEETRGDKLESSFATEQRKTFRLERELQLEQRSKKVLVLATSRAQGFNTRLNRELDSLTTELEGTESCLEGARARNCHLSMQILRSQSEREDLSEEVKRKSNALDLSRQKVRDLNGDMGELREEIEKQSAALSARAEVLKKVETLADGRRKAIVVLHGEKRRLTDEGRIDKTKIQRLKVEKTAVEGEFAASRSGVRRLLKAKVSLQQDLGEYQAGTERMEVSESTLRHHLVGSRAKLGQLRAERKVLLETLDRSRSTVERLQTDGISLGNHVAASLAKVGELQVERTTLSDSLDESRAAVERLTLSETNLLQQVQKLEAEVAALKTQGEASVNCFEQFLYEGLCHFSKQSWVSGSPDIQLVVDDA